MSLNIDNLKSKRNEILKAEIVSYFALLEKTFSDWWKGKGYFGENSLGDLNNEIKNLLQTKLQDISLNLSIIFNDQNVSSVNLWDDFINIKWREWRKVKLQDNPNKFLQVLYGSCEGINSGIEKGSPKEQIRGKYPYLSNSFGTLRKITSEEQLDKLRNILFKESLLKNDNEISQILGIDLYKFFTDKKKKYLSKNIKALLLELNDSPDFKRLMSIKIGICALFKLLYGLTPSDSRFPANDTSLFDQSYMSTSLFKAALSGLILSADNSESIDISNFDYSKIKWSILGVQYDKLSLAEKGLKPAHILWYRETSNKVDNKIKKLLEIDYPIGNEVYRDETGIYFVVGEQLLGNASGNFYKLCNELDVIQKAIIDIFSDKFEGEIYPAIFITAPSRGLMNLGHLIGKAKENFLKAERPDKFTEKLKHDEKPVGICQVCGLRLANKDGKNDLICDVCNKRKNKRLEDWFNNIADETIWTNELQDKNGRMALVTLKFELDNWINGNLVNSLLVRQENFISYKEIIKKLINFIKESLAIEELKGLNLDDNIEKDIEKFLELFDENGIQLPFKIIFQALKDNKSINNVSRNQGYRSIAFRLLKEEKWIEQFAFFTKKRKQIVKNIKKRKNENLSDYDTKNGAKEHLYEIFSINYVILQIKNILIERSIGHEWENFISNRLNKNTEIKIDFENRIINWDKLDKNDIEYLSQIILQFLFRKNPSPARLRRIWETTEGFFINTKNILEKLTGFFDNLSWRNKRIVWNVKKRDGSKLSYGEYRLGEIDFYCKDNKLYLISSIEKAIPFIKNKDQKIDDIIKKIENDDITWLKSELKLFKYGDSLKKPEVFTLFKPVYRIFKPYISIINPTPISWQFAIPADRVSDLTKNIQEEYYKYFRWVYGKLPLHVGVIIQDYKKPLYIGIKALRKIRRDDVNWDELKGIITSKFLKSRQKQSFNYQESIEKDQDCEKFYSLFEKTDEKGKYCFYLYPEQGEKRWLDIAKDTKDTEKFYFYPNTFDFEFLDVNTRRNDIYYENGKRFMKLKKQRPYDLYKWQYFEKFREYFKDKKSSSKLQKLVSVIYSKLEEWKGENEQIKIFMLSAFINILELQCSNKDIDKEKKNNFAKMFGENSWEDFENLSPKEFINKLYMLLNMFELFHSALKEV